MSLIRGHSLQRECRKRKRWKSQSAPASISCQITGPAEEEGGASYVELHALEANVDRHTLRGSITDVSSIEEGDELVVVLDLVGELNDQDGLTVKRPKRGAIYRSNLRTRRRSLFLKSSSSWETACCSSCAICAFSLRELTSWSDMMGGRLV